MLLVIPILSEDPLFEHMLHLRSIRTRQFDVRLSQFADRAEHCLARLFSWLSQIIWRNIRRQPAADCADACKELVAGQHAPHKRRRSIYTAADNMTELCGS